MRDACFWKHVLGLSLSMVALCAPGPLGTWTPHNQSSTTTDFYSAVSAQEDAFTETTSRYSESPSTSQGHRLYPLSATAGHSDTAETQPFAETSSSSLESTSLTTEPSSSSSLSSSSLSSSSLSSSSLSSSSLSSSSLSSSSLSSSSLSSSSLSSSSLSTSSLSTSSLSSFSLSSSSLSSATSEAIYSSSTHLSDGTDSTYHNDGTQRDQAPVSSPAVSWEPRVWTWTETEDSSLPRDSPDSTLRLGDATELISQTAINTDSAYTSTTMSRAGERTLLSVVSFQNNSTSPLFTEHSVSHQPPATWPLPLQTVKTEDYTDTLSVHKTEVAITEHRTDLYREAYSEIDLPVSSSGTETVTNSTENDVSFSSPITSNLMPSLAVTKHSTGQTEVLVSSTPPMLSPAILVTNTSTTDGDVSFYYETSTKVSTELHSQSTEGLPSRTQEHSETLSLTPETPTVSSRMDDSLTEIPLAVTDVFPTTTLVTVTERPQLHEEATSLAAASATSVSLSHTSTSKHTTSSSITSASQTQAIDSHTILSTKASTPEQQTTTAASTPSAVASYTLKPSTNAPTERTTLQIKTSTSPLDVTTAANSQVITTVSTYRTSTHSTETQTAGKWDGGEKTTLVTTTATVIQPPPPPPPPRNPCVSNPCMNGGMCVSYTGLQFSCHCQQAWTGPTCNEDVNECEKDPCPVGSSCVNTRGSFSCECPLGFDLEDGRTCTRAKTFLGTFSVNRQPHDPLIFKTATMHEIQREIIQLLNASLSVLEGYTRSTLSKKEESGIHIFAVNMFSISADITSTEVFKSIQMSLTNCTSSLSHCRMVLHHQLTYQVESLCEAQKTQCDTERSLCTDNSGTASCQCLQGYYKHNPEDLSCLECGDGYKLENDTCVPCMFGFGGFNCGNFYKLIAVVVSPAGGGILLILIIALIITCFKKDKNDINKIIFKSGDLKMSPYPDFPKTNRISMEWGRETIEMQENGSTKNLLQMTDIYYSPALRNADLERNGLYPFPGLPGSRHSCIYPAQWNPSFTSDDSRRRDYF